MNELTRKGQCIVQVAAVVGQLGAETLRRIDQALALPGGEAELVELLTEFYALDEPNRRAVVAALRDTPALRVVGG